MVALSSRLTSSSISKENRQSACQQIGLKKTTATRGFFDCTSVHPVFKNRVLRCMSISGDDVENWRSFVINDGFGRMFDSFMRIVCDKKLIATANEAKLTIENGCKPKTFKKMARFFFYKEFEGISCNE